MPFQVYRASAGSGKTFTLVSEYLRLCLSTTDSMAFSKILAITFTNKAAGEMKSRIMESLETLRDPSEKPDDALRKVLLKSTGLSEQQLADRSAKVLRQMLHNYGLIGISTIDRFTLRILKSFAHDLGLPAKFEVTMDRDALITNIVDMILEQVGHDKGLTDALLDLVESRAEDEKSWKIEDLLEQTAKEIFNEDGRIRMAELADVEWSQLGELRKKLTAYNKQYESHLKALGKKGADLIEENKIDLSSFSRGNSGIGKCLINLSNLKFSDPWPNSYVEATINDNKWLSGKCPPDQAASIEA
ncbi:MAG: ATP-dependent exoDNAse (exonuclease V) beta subunit, partial [Flavobacteriales bacterium]